jgi:hypothetical protein
MSRLAMPSRKESEREMSRTPGPWRFEPHSETVGSRWLGNIIGAYGLDDAGIESIRTIACLTKYGPPSEYSANARFIVTACNAHDDLVKALNAALDDPHSDISSGLAQTIVAALAKAGAS